MRLPHEIRLLLTLCALPLAGDGLFAQPAKPDPVPSIQPANEARAAEWTLVPSDRMHLVVQKQGVTFVHFRTRVLGPGWKEPDLQNLARVAGVKREFAQQGIKFSPSAAIDLRYEAEQTAPDTLTLTYEVTPREGIAEFRVPTAKATDPFATFGLAFRAEGALQKGLCTLTTQGGGTSRFTLPPGGIFSHENATEIRLASPSGDTLHLAFEPALTLASDAGEIRLFARQPARAGQTVRQTIRIVAPAPLNFEPDNRWVRTENWFPLRCDNDLSAPSEISLADWQDRPAGKRGVLLTKGDRYEFEDGTPAKLWGVNLINGGVDKALLDQWALALPKYGFNLARLVAFARPNEPKRWSHYVKIQDVNDGLKFDAAAMDIFDYGFAKLKENGVYSGFSPFYGWYPTAADKSRLLAYDELLAIANKGMPASGSFYGATCIAPDVQDLIIDFHVRLLNHVNPHTGLRYADDPALVFVELQNEENTFLQLWGIAKMLDQAPAYRKLYHRGFADWLSRRYGTRDALAKAWGSELGADENLDEATVSPLPAYFAGNAKSRRTADQMAYIAQTQRDYYRRFVDAVRKTGYRGGLGGSCWQGINWIGHLHNVQTDREVGRIDRHNYATADFKNPGTGLMSAGLQAVADRPFSYSEWHGGHLVGMHPDMPLVAAYGMGLQGWDLSMGFAWGDAAVRTRASNSINNIFNGFGMLCQSPALARMVRRQDLREGDIVGVRRVSLPALNESGDVGFTETFSLLGGANNKRFVAAVPNEALAAGRVVLEFSDGPVEQAVTDKSAPYIDAARRVIRSTTGELFWDYSGEGCFTIDTAGTQGAVGFVGGQTIRLGRVTLEPETPYAHIYVTALEADKTLADSRRMLVTAMARTVNPGTRFDAFSERPVAVDASQTGALLIEPVKATITVKSSADARVYALDHDGRSPKDARPLPVDRVSEGIRFVADGARSRTVYYLIESGPPGSGVASLTSAR